VPELFEAACATGEPQPAPLELDRAALRLLAEEGRLPAILRRIAPASTPTAPDRRLSPELLAGLPAEEREAVVLDCVRAHAAEGLGYASAEQVDAERTFVELGLDSLAAIGIRDGLAEATGVELPIPFLAGLPTLVEIARYLEGRLSAPGADPGGGGEAQDTFVSLLGEARERGKSSEFMGLLADASKLRATFDAVPPTEDLPRVVTLAEGDDRPRLILLPSLVAMSGPQEYVRFASGFRGRREVSAVVLPGYARKEPLPAGVGVLAEAGAEAILRSGLGSDFALAGYSSGGWVAHAVAARLESEGVAPAAVVLLDTPASAPDAPRWLELVLSLDWRQDDQMRSLMSDTRLTAMAAYFRLFAEWTPEELRTPVLTVRAAEPFAGLAANAEDTQALFAPAETVEVPGDHLSMLLDHAGSTAQAVEGLIERQIRPNALEGNVAEMKGEI
jgi:thioesterase domain-containing protein/acyl carrier protein